MKKFLALCILLLITLTSTISVRAEEVYSSNINVSYTYDAETDVITIIANFIDITAKDGIISVEYDVKYDPSVIELIKTEPMYPESWDTLIGSGALEDLSASDGEGVFHWAFAMISLGYGVKEDNELGLRLEFKPLKRESTTVEFVYDDILTEVIENGMTLDLLHVSGSNAKISINYDASQTPSDDSQVESSVSDIDTSSDADTDTSTESDDKVIPSIEVEIIDENSSVPIDEVNSNEQGDWIKWVLIVGGILIVVAVLVIILVKYKRGKKQ